MPLLPTFIEDVKKDALKRVNSTGYENRIAIQGSRFSHPRPASRALLTVTTRSDGIPDWYRSRLDNQAAIYGSFAQVPCVSHTIFNMGVTAGIPAIIVSPRSML